jgi:hypothetical protein
MEEAARDEDASEKRANRETSPALRHDINNQLSNILLSMEQLKYEIQDASEDCAFYLDLIEKSVAKINSLLNPPE